MNAGFYLAVSEPLVWIEELSRFREAPLTRTELERAVKALELTQYKAGELSRRFRGRLGTVETIDVEAQDISDGDEVFFSKQNERHTVVSNKPTPDMEGFVRLTFEAGARPGWYLDLEKSETLPVMVGTMESLPMQRKSP